MGDAALAAAAAARGWPGDGSEERPYVISGLELARGGWGGACRGAFSLCIEATRAHVVIESSVFHGSLELHDVENAVVRGNALERASYYRLYDGIVVANSRSVVVEGNRLVLASIEGQRVDGLVVRGNVVDGSGGFMNQGIEIEFGVVGSSVGNVVEANALTGIESCAIRIASLAPTVVAANVASRSILAVCASYGTYRMTDNLVRDMTYWGISVSSFSDAHVEGNVFERTPRALNAVNGVGLTVVGNSIGAAGGEWAMRVMDVSGFRVAGNAVERAWGTGILVAGARDGVVDANAVRGAAEAVAIEGSTRVDVVQNDVAVGGDAFVVPDGAIEVRGGSSAIRVLDNVVREPAGPALLVEDSSALEVRGNALASAGGRGVIVEGATNVTLALNDVGAAEIGLRDTHGSRVIGNGVAGGAILLTRSDGNEIAGNDAAGGRIALRYSMGNDVRGNVAGGPGLAAITLDHGGLNDVAGNALAGSGVGVLLAESDGNTLRTNVMTANDVGVHMIDSNDNLVFDNYFDNAWNARVEAARRGVGNEWDVPKSPGPNVVGGGFVGGNYWSDATTTDVDGDGLGEVPHGPVPAGPAFALPRDLDANPIGLAIQTADGAARAVGAPVGVAESAYHVAHHGPNDRRPLACGLASLQPTPLSEARCLPHGDLPAFPPSV